MARRDKPRYLITKSGPAGGLPRHYWEPDDRLRAEGWRPQRVPQDWARYTDAAALWTAAVARATELNLDLDRRREEAALRQVRPAPPPAQRTLGMLIRAYRASRAFTRLAPKTQRGYRQCLDRLDDWGGDAPLPAITAPRVQRLLEANAATPAFANAIVRVLRLVLAWGKLEGWVTANAAERPRLVGAKPSGLIWPHAAVTTFVQAADAAGRWSVGTAVMLNEWLGQREGDILTLSRHMIRNGKLWIGQSKTGARVALPVNKVPHLAQRLAEEEARQVARAAGGVLPLQLIVSEETGMPYKEDNFRHVFATIRAEAAKLAPDGFPVDYLMPGRDATDPQAMIVRMEDLTFRHLRHTAVTRNGEAEVPATLISSITGHSVKTVDQLLDLYMVRTSRMAEVAFTMRMEREGLALGRADTVAAS